MLFSVEGVRKLFGGLKPSLASGDTIVGWAKELARPFSIYAGSAGVTVACFLHPDPEIVAIAAAMVSGNAYFHGQTKVAMARVDAEASPETINPMVAAPGATK